MENASKALIVAGAILICLVLVSVGMLIVNSSTQVTDQVGDLTTTKSVQVFNNQFSNYTGVQSGSGLKSLFEKVATNNKNAELTSGHKVKVSFFDYDIQDDWLMIESDDASEMVSILSRITKSKKYFIEAKVDRDGYINSIVIMPEKQKNLAQPPW